MTAYKINKTYKTIGNGAYIRRQSDKAFDTDPTTNIKTRKPDISVSRRGKQYKRVAINEWEVTWEHRETKEVPVEIIAARNLLRDKAGINEAIANEAFTGTIYEDYMNMPQTFDGYNIKSKTYCDTKKISAAAIPLLEQNTTYIGAKQAYFIDNGGDMEAYVWYTKNNKEYVDRLYDTTQRFTKHRQYLTPQYAIPENDMYKELTEKYGQSHAPSPWETDDDGLLTRTGLNTNTSAFTRKRKRDYAPTG